MDDEPLNRHNFRTRGIPTAGRDNSMSSPKYTLSPSHAWTDNMDNEPMDRLSFQEVLRPAAERDDSMISSSHTMPAPPLRRSYPVSSKLCKDDTKLNDIVGNMKLLPKDVTKMKDEEKRRNSILESSGLKLISRGEPRKKSGVESKHLVQKNVNPIRKSVNPGQKNWNPVQENANPVQKNVNPVQKSVNPVQKNSNPVQENAYPFQKNINPVKKSVNPVQKNSNPVQENSNPVRENANSVQKNFYPVQINVYIGFFLIIFVAIFIKFLVIHQKCQIDIDVDNFEREFDENVYGQHIAKFALFTTLRSVSQRMQNDAQVLKNLLVFSFHGWTGVGKNFVTKQLGHGFPNLRVTTFLVPSHFPPATSDETYKENVQLWVKGNITRCYANMFVFDEMDKATPSLVDGLFEVMKHIQTIEMQDTWIIFIFLSNLRGHQINNVLFSKIREGKSRYDLTFNDIYSVLTDVDTEKPREWYHKFSEHGLIDTFVPFLPLNKHHVHQCIEKDLMKKGRQPTTDLIETISDEMHYIQPVKDMDHFSLTGCKRVSDKVDMHI